MKTIIIVLLSLLVFACSNNNHEEMGHDMEHQNHEHQKKSSEESMSELIRKGIIDVESLDLNKDGSVYECPMDWNVLGDNSGDCPTCGMKLKEFSISEIKSNLEKYGYEYKK